MFLIVSGQYHQVISRMASSPGLLHRSSFTYFTAAAALFICTGVASETGWSRALDLESFNVSSHSLFINTQTQQWENITNQNIQNNNTLHKASNEISLKEYITFIIKNSNKSNSTTHRISNIDNSYRNYNSSYNNNISNNKDDYNNNNKDNTNNTSDYNRINNKNNNDDNIINIKSNDNRITKNNENKSITNDINLTVSRDILKLPLVIDDKLIVMNTFKDSHFMSNKDTDPYIGNNNDSKKNMQLENTWAKIRRSAFKSSDSLLPRIPHAGDGIHRADGIIKLRHLEEPSNIATSLRQQFNVFKDYLSTSSIKGPSNADFLEEADETFVERPKTIRKAGEELGMVESGVLPVSAHPILFLPQSQRTVIGQTSGRGGISRGSGGHAGGSFIGRLRLGTNRTPPSMSRMPVHYAIPFQSAQGMSPELVRLLQARLGSSSRRLEYDPSIFVDFLTLVSLSQRHNSASGDIIDVGRSSRTEQREATLFGNRELTSPLRENQPTIRHNQGEFGPFSDGNDPAAGIDPSNIDFPPRLRQTLYSYLLPRLSALGGLLDTVPGVPGLDYPIIASVPYTNFYCQEMPWPGFYADTEARCQTWHFCDLEGRQSSFLCPNGTVFNQAFLVCDWWYNFDCQTAPFLYAINERVFDLPEIDETAPHRSLTPEILDSLFL